MTGGGASLPSAAGQVVDSQIAARLAAGAQGYFGSPVLHVEPLGTVPRVFSTVLRLHVQTAESSMVVFAKRFRPRDGEDDDRLRARVVREYEQTLLAYDGLRHAPGLGAVRPLAVPIIWHAGATSITWFRCTRWWDAGSAPMRRWSASAPPLQSRRFVRTCRPAWTACARRKATCSARTIASGGCPRSIGVRRS